MYISVRVGGQREAARYGMCMLTLTDYTCVCVCVCEGGVVVGLCLQSSPLLQFLLWINFLVSLGLS
jgi:hypothetical protein